MTLEQHIDQLLEVGMGWLGWTYDETVAAPMVEIERARDGRVKLINLMFGGSPDGKPPKTKQDKPSKSAVARGLARILRSHKKPEKG